MDFKTTIIKYIDFENDHINQIIKESKFDDL